MTNNQEVCICGHTAHWHADRLNAPGTGTCEGSAACHCQRFTAIPEPNSDPSAVGGERLLGAERLMRRYMDARVVEAAETGGIVAEADVHAFHRMAGLADDWGDIALTLAMQKARGQLYLALGIPPDADLTGTTISLDTDLLINLIASGELHGMTLGVLAALNITDPANG